MVFCEFHTPAEKQLRHTLKAIQTDGGGEFKFLSIYLPQFAIVYPITCLCSSQ